jgi:hypothetical protein
MGDPAHTSHLAATRGTQHPPDRLIGHARPLGQPVAVVPLFQHAGERVVWDDTPVSFQKPLARGHGESSLIMVVRIPLDSP